MIGALLSEIFHKNMRVSWRSSMMSAITHNIMNVTFMLNVLKKRI